MRAIVLAAPVRPGETTLPADASLAGLPLALRAMLTAQQQGATSLLLVAPADIGARLAADPRLHHPPQVVPPAGDGTVDWAALAAAAEEPFVLLRHHWPLAPAGYHALLQSQLRDEALALRAMLNGAFAEALAGGPALLQALAQGTLRWEALAGTAADRTGAGTIEALVLPEGSWSFDASTPQGRRATVTALFEACRKPVDGLVSRNLNRHVSIWISRRLVDTPITPNMMTGVTFAVGLVAAWFASRGGYANTLAAGALMQLNSILDGCDGELARVRFQGSKLGQWLDTIGDDATNVIFWTALGCGALQLPDPSWLPAALSGVGGWLALCAWIAAGANALAALQYYALLRRLGSGDFYAIQQDDKPPPAGLAGAVVRFFSLILKQDFFLFLVLLLAVFDSLVWSLPVIALGALITLGSATARTLRARH